MGRKRRYQVEEVVEKEILMELADELLQDNYGSLKFRELLAQTSILDTGLRWQVSNEISRRLINHVLKREEPQVKNGTNIS